jgi:4-phospho-D-threonate 3-dehydrogenase / 4-phospho-D-erythronate 3-dehydrogenase
LDGILTKKGGLLMKLPVIGIPMGDPSGIGPEIIVKALSSEEVYHKAHPIIIGNVQVLKNIADITGVKIEFNIAADPKDGIYETGVIDVINSGEIDIKLLKFGEIQAQSGKAAFECIRDTVKLAIQGKIDVIATTPINKEAIKAAGIDFIGHTEMLAGLTGTDELLTMFQVRDLRIFFLSRHVSLLKACDMIKKDRIGEYIIKCDEALKLLGIKGGRIAVAGMNPHSGEHGLFGDEEAVEIYPAIKEAAEKGIRVTGPVPADSVFHLALNGRYDAVLSLYHDQGHIAAKTLDFERTISLTFGMKFLRTSVDHGTAFDIAGKGIASAVSMKEAIRLAALYAFSYKQGFAALTMLKQKKGTS